MTDPLARLADLVAAARRAGADAAEAMLVETQALAVQRRLGAVERIERTEARELGLRVFVGRRQAVVASSDDDPARFADLAARAVAMARAVPEDPHAGLAEAPDGMAGFGPRCAALDLLDPVEPSIAALAARAAAAEEAALAVPGVTNSDGASAEWGRSTVSLVASNGFAGTHARSRHAVSVTALAGSGTAMERDYDFAAAVHAADLEDPAAVGRRAGEQAVARLGPRRPRSGTMPVVFHPRVAASLLAHLAAAINGAAVVRGTTFLRDALGRCVFAPGVTIHDDPLRRRGLRSRPFDAEGIAGGPRALVEDGVLASFLLDCRSARALGTASTGHAARSVAAVPVPAPSNLWLAPGPFSPAALIADIAEGLYVTELLGMGVNLVSGDYSRGAAGFMIRHGVLAEPVNELTIAGNLREMFRRLVPADDLVFRRGTDAPSVRIDGLTVAGNGRAG